MRTRSFIDSNVLVYSVDDDEPAKQVASRAILRDLMESRSGVISTQVLQEFASVATRKIGIPPMSVKVVLRSWTMMETVLLTSDLISAAIDDMVLHHLSFWDSLIIAAAASAHCTELLTEDFNDGQTIRGITVRNPFA